MPGLLFRVVSCNYLVGLAILWQGGDMPIPLDFLFSQREQRRATVASRWEWLPLATTDHLPACRESVARLKQSMNGCLYEMVVGGYGVCMAEDHVSLSQIMAQSTKSF